MIKPVNDYRQERIDRLSEAIGYYLAHPPALVTRQAIKTIANRFMVAPKSLEQAIKLIAQHGPEEVLDHADD